MKSTYKILTLCAVFALAVATAVHAQELNGALNIDAQVSVSSSTTGTPEGTHPTPPLRGPSAIKANIENRLEQNKEVRNNLLEKREEIRKDLASTTKGIQMDARGDI